MTGHSQPAHLALLAEVALIFDQPPSGEVFASVRELTTSEAGKDSRVTRAIQRFPVHGFRVTTILDTMRPHTIEGYNRPNGYRIDDSR